MGQRRPRPAFATLVACLCLLLTASLGSTATASAATETWNAPLPAGYDWVVPAGITTARFQLLGAQGAGAGASFGGRGGTTSATIAVTPGETLKINVGGAGAPPGLGGSINGGGATGSPVCTDGGFACRGGDGGGASDVRRGGSAPGDRVLVAGGGGGAGGSSSGFCNMVGCLVSVGG